MKGLVIFVENELIGLLSKVDAQCRYLVEGSERIGSYKTEGVAYSVYLNEVKCEYFLDFVVKERCTGIG